MEQHLVDEFIGLEFGNEFLLVQETLFIEGERGINTVVGYGTIHQIIIVGKVALRAVGMDKVHPFVTGRIAEIKTLETLRCFFVQFVNIDEAGIFTGKLAKNPLPCLLLRGGGIEAGTGTI